MADAGFIAGFLSGLGVTSIAMALIENKYHFVNTIRKRYAIVRNKNTESKFSMEFTAEKEFDEIKENFKEIFRKENNFRVIKENDSKIEIVYDIFSIKLLNTQDGNISIITDRIGCGIKDLKSKITTILGKLKDLEKNKTFNDFVSGELVFSLPYKWDNLNIWSPKGLKIKKYNVSFSDPDYGSEININLNKVNAKTDTKEAIVNIIDKFL